MEIIFSPIDIIAIIILVFGFIWGFNRGFIYMLFSLLAIVLGVISAGKLVPLLLPKLFKNNFQIWYIILFIIIFTIVYFIIRKISYLFEDIIEFLELEWLDCLLGGILGTAQFFIILGIIYSILQDFKILSLFNLNQNIKIMPYISLYSKIFVNFLIGNYNLFKNYIN